MVSLWIIQEISPLEKPSDFVFLHACIELSGENLWLFIDTRNHIRYYSDLCLSNWQDMLYWLFYCKEFKFIYRYKIKVIDEFSAGPEQKTTFTKVYSIDSIRYYTFAANQVRHTRLDLDSISSIGNRNLSASGNLRLNCSLELDYHSMSFTGLR